MIQRTYFLMLAACLSSQLLCYLPSNDTWSLQAELYQLTGSSDFLQGASVAISGDENTIAVGIPNSSSNSGGETQIYVRSGNRWLPQQTIVGQSQGSQEGTSVSLSSDGNTLAVGAPHYNSGAGATNIYVRSGTSWSLQDTLSSSNSGTTSAEGCSVCLSQDGNTLAAGAPGYNNFDGAIQLYVRNGTSWSKQATLSQSMPTSHEGFSVSLSADGNTLAAGAPGYRNLEGATTIYNRLATTWGYKQMLSKGTQAAQEGTSVSLSADGGTLAVSAQDRVRNGSITGTIQIYSKSGAMWTHEKKLAHLNDGTLYSGNPVSLSADGNTLAVGVPDFNNTGATQLYVRSGSTWSNHTRLSLDSFNAEEGYSIALGFHGDKVIAGAVGFNQTGGIFVYVN
jgi:hypothetical protein